MSTFRLRVIPRKHSRFDDDDDAALRLSSLPVPKIARLIM
jgi:hypothetical protein